MGPVLAGRRSIRYGGDVDREYGAMVQAPNTPVGESNWSGPKQFAYVPYDPLTSREGLNELGLADVREEALARMDDVKQISDLQRVGAAFAQHHLRIDHLAGFV